MQSDETHVHGGKKAGASARRRLQFSLRTLLLFCLLLCSGAVLWWNWGPWEPARTFVEKEPILAAGFSPSDEYFWLRFSNTVALYDADSGERLFETSRLLSAGFGGGGGGFPFENVNFSPGEQYLCLTGEEFYTTGVNSVFRVITGDRVPVAGRGTHILGFSPNDRFLVERGNGGTVSGRTPTWWYALPDAKLVGVLEYTSRPVAFSYDSRFVAVVLQFSGAPIHGTVQVLDAETREVKHTFAPFNEYVFNLAFSPVDNTLAIAEHHSDNTFRTKFFNAETGEQIGDCAGMLSSANVPIASNRQQQWETPFSNDGARVLTFNMHNQYAMGPDSLTKVNSVPPNGTEITMALHQPLGFSASGDRVCGFYPFSAWDARSGKLLWKFELDQPRDGAFSRDGTFAFLAREKNGAESQERILDAATGETLFRFSRYRWKNALPLPRCGLVFANAHPWFITTPGIDKDDAAQNQPPPSDPSRDPRCRATLWRLRRPLGWRGLAALPEFWLTAFFACAFLWSVWRDRKAR